MIKFLKELFRGDRFVNSKYLDNQFDCFTDYVDITEEELNERMDEMEGMLAEVLEKTTDLIAELKEVLGKKAKKAKKPTVAKKTVAKNKTK